MLAYEVTVRQELERRQDEVRLLKSGKHSCTQRARCCLELPGLENIMQILCRKKGYT